MPRSALNLQSEGWKQHGLWVDQRGAYEASHIGVVGIHATCLARCAWIECNLVELSRFRVWRGACEALYTWLMRVWLKFSSALFRVRFVQCAVSIWIEPPRERVLPRAKEIRRGACIAIHIGPFQNERNSTGPKISNSVSFGLWSFLVILYAASILIKALSIKICGGFHTLFFVALLYRRNICNTWRNFFNKFGNKK